MYCGSCLHGNTLVAALREAGEDALLVPVYTPLRTDERNVSIDRVAFGGINVYLQQRSSLFRHTPWFVDRLLDHPGLLGWLSKHIGNTRPEKLGPLTVSVLQGEEGYQRKELKKLAGWLAKEVQPELIHLSNVMLSGMARRLARELRVPIVCSLSGEDIFLEKLVEPYYSQARTLLRRRCADVDALVAMNRYFADFMADYLSVPRERIHVIRPGLDLSAYAKSEGIPRIRESADQPATIGYLARVCPEKGLHLLAEAFRLLAGDGDLPPISLRAAGYLDPDDREYLARIRSKLAEEKLSDRFEYVGEVDRATKVSFLQSLDVMSVPTVYRESKGLSILEAWAAGVPVVVPEHGTFPELLADSDGGLLCEPDNPPALAAALKRMIQDPQFAAECGHSARQTVRRRYNAPLMAERTIALYQTLRRNHEEHPA